MAPPPEALGWLMFGGFVLWFLFLLALGMWYPGTGAKQVDWSPTRSVEQEIQLELDDVEQMLEANNERRRATGRPELTEEGLREEVAVQEEGRLRADGLL